VNAPNFMRKAVRSLNAARLLLDNGYTDEACSRAYYAMFDAARAALLASSAPVEAEVARTHGGLLSAFSQSSNPEKSPRKSDALSVKRNTFA
jgi:uncharacterized protein (UPF0332 family)